MGLPELEEIARVEITNARLSQEPKVFEDAENIELARKVAIFLNYKPGTVESGEYGDDFITIRYEEADGTVTEISANETTVFWRGKAHELKHDDTFVNLVEGIFFGEAAEADESVQPADGEAETADEALSETTLAAETVTGEAAMESEEITEMADNQAVGQSEEAAREQTLINPDVFKRYLGQADLYKYTKEELRLLRNEIYAIHGAQFQSEDLKQYFGEKSWYQGIPATEFSDQMLSEVERANIALIKEWESRDGLVIDGKDYGSAFSMLPDAPYLTWLDQYHETGLHADMSQAADMGLYYAVPGEISIPVTLNEEQIQALENGEELEIIIDEVNDEAMMLCKLPGSAPGAQSYLYYEPGSQPDQYTLDAYAAFDQEHGIYTLWCLSDDTIMKTVYQGDIYILKGAVYGVNVGLLAASEDQWELSIPQNDGDSRQMEIGGNRVSHDGRGYITAVYGLGD